MATSSGAPTHAVAAALPPATVGTPNKGNAPAVAGLKPISAVLCSAAISAGHILDFEKDEHRLFKLALEDWEKTAEVLRLRTDRLQGRCTHNQYEIYQLIGFYSVFQGVLFGAVAQAQVLHCRNLWSGIVLSSLVSAVTIAAVVHKLFSYIVLEKEIAAVRTSAEVLRNRIAKLRSKGVKFSWSEDAKDGEGWKPPESVFWYGFVVILVLGILEGAFLASFIRILCFT